MPNQQCSLCGTTDFPAGRCFSGHQVSCQKKHLKLTRVKKTDIRSPSPPPLIPLPNDLPDPPTVRSPSLDELPSPAQLLYGMPPDPSPPNPPQPIPSASTLSQTSQRPMCQRKLPPHFEDYNLSFKSTYLSQVIAESQPSQPLRHHSLDPSPEPSPSLPSQELGTPINHWCTPQNGLGIYWIYHFRLPSQDPNEDLTIDDLVASNTFAKLAGDAREGQQPSDVLGQVDEAAAVPLSCGPLPNVTVQCTVDWYYNVANGVLSYKALDLFIENVI
ncbi:hypothetical protein E1B28_013186 [Marasmius oreades]|uniref:Uncharacterized protein n=1 Tax=Marasmius oreades TaxID=181124 RepID=A0A9P7RQ16_9AGAR|nr:uncharacterized protein E1B28_013186 [Marasmius oreades]KAG7087205.1 hypothetical protein E1B28_013186 [Marasmius oreades]